MRVVIALCVLTSGVHFASGEEAKRKTDPNENLRTDRRRVGLGAKLACEVSGGATTRCCLA